MYYVKMNFSFKDEHSNNVDTEELISEHIVHLVKNGQLMFHYEMLSNDNRFIVYGTVPEEDSLNEKNNSKDVNKTQIKIDDILNVSFEILGKKMWGLAVCNCDDPSWLFCVRLIGMKKVQ